MDWTLAPHCPISSEDIPKYRLVSGDIVFARTGATTGKSFLITDPPEAVFASYLIRLRLSDQSLLPRFVARFFQTDEYWKAVREGSSGSAQGGFNASKLGALRIPVPPLTEQQRIVGILDEAMAGIATAQANAEKNLQNARALFESHREAVLAGSDARWLEKPLADICEIKHGFAFQSGFFAKSGEFVLLTPGNFYEKGGYRDRGEKQKYYVGDIPEGFILEKGDLLVAMTEQAAGLLGSPVLIPESGKFLHNQRLGLVTAKQGVPWTNEFFFHVFNTRAVRKAIHDRASGVKVRRTSPGKIGEVIVRFPADVLEQRRIVDALDSLFAETQRLASIYERKLAALDELKKSLLHQAFTGKL